jgi:hypothetical protein
MSATPTNLAALCAAVKPRLENMLIVGRPPAWNAPGPIGSYADVRRLIYPVEKVADLVARRGTPPTTPPGKPYLRKAMDAREGIRQALQYVQACADLAAAQLAAAPATAEALPAQPTAGLTGAGLLTPPPGRDPKDYVLVSVLWPNRPEFKRPSDVTKFFGKVPDEPAPAGIRNYRAGPRRRLVHETDWHRYFREKDRRASEALDAEAATMKGIAARLSEEQDRKRG